MVVYVAGGFLGERSRALDVQLMHHAFKKAVPADDRQQLATAVILRDVAGNTWGGSSTVWTLPTAARAAGYAHLQSQVRHPVSCINQAANPTGRPIKKAQCQLLFDDECFVTRPLISSVRVARRLQASRARGSRFSKSPCRPTPPVNIATPAAPSALKTPAQFFHSRSSATGSDSPYCM